MVGQDPPYKASGIKMCLGIPMKVVEKEGEQGVVEVEGVKRGASFMLVPEVKVGDYVIIHAGFAIEKLDEEEARKTLRIILEGDFSGI